MDNMEKELWDAFYGKESKQERCSVLTEAELNKHNKGMLKEGYMSDEDIHNQFSKFEVLDFSKEGEHSGYIELSFPNADEVDYDSNVITGYTIYEDGKVAFDNWFPDDVYNEVAEYVKQHHSEELDEGCGKKKKKALKESDEDMSGYEDRLNKTIKSEMKKFPKYAADAKKALDDGDEIKKILNKYNQEYNFLYNNHDKVAGYEEAVRAWDEYINHPDFRELIGKVIKARHDMFTSDREIGALMFALDALGYLDKFDGKESSLEPVVKEFKMNESEEKTNTPIVDLDSIVRKLKKTKNLTISKRIKILEPYNLTPEQEKYVLDELHGVSRGHAYLYGPSEF